MKNESKLYNYHRGPVGHVGWSRLYVPFKPGGNVSCNLHDASTAVVSSWYDWFDFGNSSYWHAWVPRNFNYQEFTITEFIITQFTITTAMKISGQADGVRLIEASWLINKSNN